MNKTDKLKALLAARKASAQPSEPQPPQVSEAKETTSETATANNLPQTTTANTAQLSPLERIKAKIAAKKAEAEKASSDQPAQLPAQLPVTSTQPSTATQPPQLPPQPTNNDTKSAVERLREKIRQAKAANNTTNNTTNNSHSQPAPANTSAENLDVTADTANSHTSDTTNTSNKALGMSGEVITYNEQQQKFIDILGSGNSCVLIGAAGTGKTTCSKGGINALISSGVAGVLKFTDEAPHKHLVNGTAGAVIISYTRRAVNNIRKVQSEDMKKNCVTAHKLLEYQPEEKEIFNPETGETRKSKVFMPSRNSSNPLPASLKVIIVEEASMLSVELYKEIVLALPKDIIWVFIGDLNQLPPVFGSAILGYKLLELPVVELTEVYRQALESPIISLAHRILSGKPIPVEEFESLNVKNQLTLHPWKKKLSDENAAMILIKFFANAYDKGAYDVEEDMILIPYNKGCGTIEVNKGIANHIARKHGRTTYEIIAGFNTHYLSVGDKILVDREDGEVVEITPNTKYFGKSPQHPSIHLDYWGCNQKPEADDIYEDEDDTDIDAMLDNLADFEVEDRKTQCSHIVKVKLAESEQVVELTSASAINNILLSYAMTVHKAQGSEWRKVFFCLHQSHATMLQRELLYTGVTRAREELYIICEPNSFVKGIQSQKIKGDTLEEKAEFFKGKLEANDGY